MISRSNVTKRVNKYVTENGLKHPDNGRILILDDKMNELLKPPADLQITFLNIQKFLSPHYIKTGPAVTEAATTMVSMAATKDVKIEPEVTSAPEVVNKKKRPVVRKPKAAAASTGCY
jgi:chromatin remodeling complex protein RSC6